MKKKIYRLGETQINGKKELKRAGRPVSLVASPTETVDRVVLSVNL